MSDIRALLEKQAQWQKSRRALTWPEKVRMAEQVRASVRLLRASAGLEIRENRSTGTTPEGRLK